MECNGRRMTTDFTNSKGVFNVDLNNPHHTFLDAGVGGPWKVTESASTGLGESPCSVASFSPSWEAIELIRFSWLIVAASLTIPTSER